MCTAEPGLPVQTKAALNVTEAKSSKDVQRRQNIVIFFTLEVSHSYTRCLLGSQTSVPVEKKNFEILIILPIKICDHQYFLMIILDQMTLCNML